MARSPRRLKEDLPEYLVRDSVGFSISIAQALEESARILRESRALRGVKRVRGRVKLSVSSEQTLQKSIRYVPARGLDFRTCQ